ncbi:MAG: CD3324 family protein [Defluviitaleaceae bacterium]|nr:CD3324 family protein [Defluviitaleaceae bacterium]
MTYVKAQTVFPQSLLNEIQKYVQGEMVYIPKKPADYMAWGAKSGAKNALRIRNENIVNLYKSGVPIGQLAENYHLSEDTIRKIIYRKA